jgi:hypothetical protein
MKTEIDHGTIEAALIKLGDASAREIAIDTGLEAKDITHTLNDMRSAAAVEREKRGNEYVYWLTTTASAKPKAAASSPANKPAPDPSPKVGETIAAWSERCAAQKPEAAGAHQEEFSLLNVIADIRQAIGDKGARIMLSDLAAAVKSKIETLENQHIKSTHEFECIGEVVIDYMPDHNGSWLIDGVRTMDKLIDAQLTRIYEQQLIIDKLFRVKRNIEDTLRPAVASFNPEHTQRGAEIMADDTAAIIANAQALTDKLQHLLDSSRHECKGLRAQLNAGAITSTLEQAAPAGYLLRVPTREHRVLTKRASAQQAAVSAVNAGAASAEVLALYPIGRASRRAQWRDA